MPELAQLLLPLAHHGLLLAIPFFGPVVLIVGFLLVMQRIDRRRPEEG